MSTQEIVLVIPAVHALLGDNPMQSELSCHVGMTGKFFCRCCWVKGRDAEDAEEPIGEAREDGGSDAGSVDSQTSEAAAPKKNGRKAETMQELVDRAHRFLGVSISILSQDLLLTCPVRLINPPQKRNHRKADREVQRCICHRQQDTRQTGEDQLGHQGYLSRSLHRPHIRLCWAPAWNQGREAGGSR